MPAAFGRLCVETLLRYWCPESENPAAFGRLCVETSFATLAVASDFQPPSGGCVLKPRVGETENFVMFPAAFGRLCVETTMHLNTEIYGWPSRLRAAVC